MYGLVFVDWDILDNTESDVLEKVGATGHTESKTGKKINEISKKRD